MPRGPEPPLATVTGLGPLLCPGPSQLLCRVLQEDVEAGRRGSRGKAFIIVDYHLLEEGDEEAAIGAFLIAHEGAHEGTHKT